MMKARYLYSTRDKNPREAWKHTELWYEYRGRIYAVTVDNNGYMGMPLKAQHEAEQARIDREIEEAEKPKQEPKYEGSAQEGFDLFWEYINQ